MYVWILRIYKFTKNYNYTIEKDGQIEYVWYYKN